MAYSLFGIFRVSIIAKYGEGQQHALGRLLQEVLTQSGDVTILAWTGKSSEYNSCLPAEIGAYRQPESDYIPPHIEQHKMEALVQQLQTSKHLHFLPPLYSKVFELHSPRLFSGRLSLPCIVFQLEGPFVQSNVPSIYRVTTPAFGDVKIKITDPNLFSSHKLVLVHPWLHCLLDHTLPPEDPSITEPSTPAVGNDEEGNPVMAFSASSTIPSLHSISPHQHAAALRLFVRLRQPFGALLLAHIAHNKFKRVASDHTITVQLLDGFSPNDLLKRIRTLDIL